MDGRRWINGRTSASIVGVFHSVGAPEAIYSVFLLVLEALVDLLEDLLLDLACKTKLLRCFRDGARWQVKVDLIDYLTEVTFHVG